jgi:hypothetical protein
MKVYKIEQTDLLNITLAQCPTLESAKKYLEKIKKNDKYLQKVYNWRKLPKYRIIESEEN